MLMVEAAGIEPASEGQATGTSTGLAPVLYLAAPASRSGIRKPPAPLLSRLSGGAAVQAVGRIG